MLKFLKERRQLRDLRIYGKIILKLILKDKVEGVEWNDPDQDWVQQMLENNKCCKNRRILNTKGTNLGEVIQNMEQQTGCLH